MPPWVSEAWLKEHGCSGREFGRVPIPFARMSPSYEPATFVLATYGEVEGEPGSYEFRWFSQGLLTFNKMGGHTLAVHKCPHRSCFYYYEDHNPSDSADAANMNHALVCIGQDGGDKLYVRKDVCVSCGRMGLSLTGSMADGDGWADPVYPYRSIYPLPKVPSEVPEEFAQDYLEAWTILGDSPRASGALSRLCLERILVEKSGVPGVTGKNLKHDIEKVVQSNTLPRSISELLDAPRLLGNLAVHAKKSSETGVVVPVEPWEAEFCLEIIGLLFNHYFVATNRNAVRLKRLMDKIDH